MRIALAGNPNSGKTTMYNVLTGKNERVGNWAGVTVDKKEHTLKKIYAPKSEEKITVIDLPGAYSMSPFTAEEGVTSSYIQNERPDVIINIVDSTNLSRSLFFTTQLLELGIPLIVALNKSDVNERNSTKINTALLSEKLGCPVLATVSTSKRGLEAVISAAIMRVGCTQTAHFYQDKASFTDKAASELADRKRFEFVKELVSAVETRTVLTRDKNKGDAVDAILTSRWLGIPIFAAVMFFVFFISQSTVGTWVADLLAGYIEMLREWVAGLLDAGEVHPLLKALIADGIIGGVGAVLGFLPLVMIMYFLIALLEDCGYMARVSVVLDPIFKRVGLSGKSVIPFVVATGCAVPGVMASRTIRGDRERRATAMLAPFMPCGAKLPVIALFAGVFFADSPWVGTVMYFAGIVIIFLGALLINRITGVRHKKSYFIMELPDYKIPSVKRALESMLSRGWSYIVKAGTVILVCNTAVQIIESFTPSFELVADGHAEDSILAMLASPFAILFIPLGFGIWQMAAAAITGFIAKENVVGTLAVCYGITNFIDIEELTLMGGAENVAEIFGITQVAALACLVFNLFSPPCFAAIGAMNSELGSVKWMLAGIGLQLAVGYTAAFAVYQLGTLFTTGSFGSAFIPGLCAVIGFVGIVAHLIIRSDLKYKAEKVG